MSSLLDAAGLSNGGGDIWCTGGIGGLTFDSPLRDLLDSGEYTLEEILAEDELLQELRGINPQLIDFFSTEEAVSGLVQYMVLSPSRREGVLREAAAKAEARTAAAANVDANADANANFNANANANANGSQSASSQSGAADEGPNGGEKEGENGEGSGNQDKGNNGNTTEAAKEPGKWLQGEEFFGDDTPRQPPKTRQEQEDDLHFRFPYMACEVISCELKGITDLIMDGFVPLLDTSGDQDDDQDDGHQNENENGHPTRAQPATKSANGSAPLLALPSASDLLGESDARGRRILDLLFSMFYEREGPGEASGERTTGSTHERGRPLVIDDYRAGYFEKVLSVLIKHRPNDVAEYLNDGGGRGRETLMAAMFDHLYSHSLLQVVQHLLMPTHGLLPQEEGEEQHDDHENECGDLFHDPLDEALGEPLVPFRCNWSESGPALEMLLECLVGKDENNNENDENDDDNDRGLDLCRNASEVLITIIQNSPLTSRTMCTLTSDPVLEKLVEASSKGPCAGAAFGRHDSRLTCAMNVLESLVLQLGGYGSVGTVVPCPGGGGENESAPLGNGGGAAGQKGGSPPPEPRCAGPDTLTKHLPLLLDSLEGLLTHPGAERWVSPMQFSGKEPQPLLGASRLRIVRLLESLVLLGNPGVDSVLCGSGCLETCLDLFWGFQWCSMLHQSVANLLVHVFEGRNARSDLQSYFLVRCNLLGRLMYSFWENGGGAKDILSSSSLVGNSLHANEQSESIMGQKDSDSDRSVPSVPSSSSSSSSSLVGGGDKDESAPAPVDETVLPVSDDDVDVAMEQQQEQEQKDGAGFPGFGPAAAEPIDEANHGSSIVSNGPPMGEGDGKPKRPFLRLGYMGHVIIICQALVQAYTKEEGDDDGGGGDNPADGLGGAEGPPERPDGDLSSNPADPPEKSRLAPNNSDSAPPSEALVLEQLIEQHPLGKIWHDFVATTLAAEFALQTTPLGGFQASTLGTDPLHMHRPGLEDSGGFDYDEDDDGGALSLPQRGGLLVDGDLIDMDDNDLEVAASMMAGLNLTGSGGDGRAQPRAPQSGYLFDDPLGGGGFGNFGNDDDEDDGSNGGSSSSDEEGDNVMDLFTGNLGDQDHFAANFEANFDDAFADVSSDGGENGPDEDRNTLDNLFGDVRGHDILLDDFEKPPGN